jgi:hypothetical protein
MEGGPVSHNSRMLAFASRRTFACHEPVRAFVRASSVHDLAGLLAGQTAARKTDHLVPWMNACISSSVSLPSLLLSIALKIRS